MLDVQLDQNTVLGYHASHIANTPDGTVWTDDGGRNWMHVDGKNAVGFIIEEVDTIVPCSFELYKAIQQCFESNLVWKDLSLSSDSATVTLPVPIMEVLFQDDHTHTVRSNAGVRWLLMFNYVFKSASWKLPVLTHIKSVTFFRDVADTSLPRLINVKDVQGRNYRHDSASHQILWTDGAFRWIGRYDAHEVENWMDTSANHDIRLIAPTRVGSGGMIDTHIGSISGALYNYIQTNFGDKIITVINDLAPILTVSVSPELHFILRHMFRNNNHPYDGATVIDGESGRQLMMVFAHVGLIDDEVAISDFKEYESFTFSVEYTPEVEEDEVPSDIQSFVDGWIIANMCDGDDRRGCKDRHHMSPDDLHDFGQDLVADLLEFMKGRTDA